MKTNKAKNSNILANFVMKKNDKNGKSRYI